MVGKQQNKWYCLCGYWYS